MWDNYGESSVGNSWEFQKNVENCIDKIKELERKPFISSVDEKELISLKDKLFEFQEKCSHVWIKVPLFVTVRRICNTCQKEDKSYDYFTDTASDKPKFS